MATISLERNFPFIPLRMVLNPLVRPSETEYEIFRNSMSTGGRFRRCVSWTWKIQNSSKALTMALVCKLSPSAFSGLRFVLSAQVRVFLSFPLRVHYRSLSFSHCKKLEIWNNYNTFFSFKNDNLYFYLTNNLNKIKINSDFKDIQSVIAFWTWEAVKTAAKEWRDDLYSDPIRLDFGLSCPTRSTEVAQQLSRSISITGRKVATVPPWRAAIHPIANLPVIQPRSQGRDEVSP